MTETLQRLFRLKPVVYLIRGRPLQWQTGMWSTGHQLHYDTPKARANQRRASELRAKVAAAIAGARDDEREARRRLQAEGFRVKFLRARHVRTHHHEEDAAARMSNEAFVRALVNAVVIVVIVVMLTAMWALWALLT